MADTNARTARAAAGESTPSLLNEALTHVTGLVRGEMDLFRAEVQENLNRAIAAVGMLVAAVVLLITALNVLAAAITAWLAETGLGPGWSALIVAGAFAIVGIVLALKGRSNLKATSLAPTRTARNVQRDAHAVKEATTNGS